MAQFDTTTNDLVRTGCISLLAFSLGTALMATGTYNASQGQSPTADFMAGGLLILLNLHLWKKMYQAHENGEFYINGVSSTDPRTGIPQLLERFGIGSQTNTVNDDNPNNLQSERTP